MAILSQISAHRARASTNTRARSNFFFHGNQVCITTYLYLHTISCTRYQNLVSHHENFGLCPRIHGNSKCLPSPVNQPLTKPHLTIMVFPCLAEFLVTETKFWFCHLI